jgi:hypothetical protein
MGASESFQKALYLLDRGDVVRGELLLRDVVRSTEPCGGALYYQACCCLGELLAELGRGAEAITLLERVAALEAEDLFDDTLSHEIQRARRLLAR